MASSIEKTFSTEKITNIVDNLVMDKDYCYERQLSVDNIISNSETVTQIAPDCNIQENSSKELSKSDNLQYTDMDVEDSSPTEDTEKPFISLTFRDAEFANIFKFQIIKHIKSLVEFDLREEVKCDSNTVIHLWDYSSFDFQKFKNKNHDEPFIVDTTPSKYDEVLPKYSPNEKSMLEDFQEDKSNDEQSLNIRSINTCFNCDGNHTMKDCKEIKDYRRICLARSKYLANTQSKSIRYHLEEDQKFKHLVPGKISEKLRKALDIRKYEVPSYIYKMRKFGYPPGWLQEAMTGTSTLELIDFHGCVIAKNDTEKTNSIDSNKIIEYPGFNVPLEKDIRDEYKYYKCPPYSESLSKKSMLEFINKVSNKLPENKSLNINIENEKSDSNNQENEKSDSNNQENECADDIQRMDSPTLNDLELKKRQLLAELEDGSTNSSLPNNVEFNGKLNIEEPAIHKENKDTFNVLSSTFGTPILSNTSSNIQLPESTKWSKDISQVINFENLPNSTGKYEQMSKVINKVRNIVKGFVFEEKTKL